jgi:phosphoglycerate dehydrogenase-like enzyme
VEAGAANETSLDEPDGHPPQILVLGAEASNPPPGIESITQNASVRFAHDGEALSCGLPGTDALFVWDFRSDELQQSWEWADSLKWVHVAGAGVDAVLFPELVESNVTLTNSRGVFDRPIAEYVIGLMLMFAKGFVATIEQQRSKQWVHRETETLSGKHLLVVGVGPIGREIARLARTLDMHIEGVARSGRESDEDFDRVLSDERLDEALPEADYVVVAAPLTERTRGMFGRESFAGMKTGARFINVGRGPIVDEDALLEALESGDLSGAALDVFQNEPLPHDSPLWEAEGMFVSPHMSGDFVGWLDALGKLFSENFGRWTRNEPLLNVVDKRRGYAGSGTSERREERR